jgi:HD-like signal output (HDOD) protein
MYGKPENNIVAPSVPHEDSIPVADEKRRKLWSLAVRYADGLPAVSGSIFRLNDLLSQSATDLKAIVRVLSMDPSMSAQVVRLANSGSGQNEEAPYRLDECAVLLGVSRLRSLVLTTALAPTDYAAATMFHALCQHCHLTSRFGERIAQACGHPEPYKANIAGLLHDLGELPVYLERRQCGEDGGSYLDHCFVGGWLAKLWNLPAFLIDVIEHHHDPTKARRDPFLAVVTAAADEVSRVYGVGLQIKPAAHLASDSTTVLDRYLTCLSQQRRHALADVLQGEFLEWVKAPVEIEPAEGDMEGKWELWQSAL